MGWEEPTGDNVLTGFASHFEREATISMAEAIKLFTQPLKRRLAF